MPVHRRRAVLLAVVAIMAIAVPAAAGHLFTDVPSTTAHHDAISELAGAGITAGCGPSAFCPGETVTRAQMAAFLRRGATRVNADSSTTTLAIGPDGSASGVPVTVEVALAGTAGGTANLALQGTVTVDPPADAAACPCEVEVFVYRAGDELQGPSSWSTLTDDGPVSVPTGWALTVPSNARDDYHVAVFVEGVDDPTGYRAHGNLTAISGPFGDTGS
jgi:hypothetical protein